eukprot:m.488005 g.488005  ORF g.488005 m.488005 type:complete len:110 (+) comp25474_c0_seq1:1021-1350(+)
MRGLPWPAALVFGQQLPALARLRLAPHLPRRRWYAFAAGATRATSAAGLGSLQCIGCNVLLLLPRLRMLHVVATVAEQHLQCRSRWKYLPPVNVNPTPHAPPLTPPPAA